MKTKLFQNKIFVKKSSMHGFGVFAGKTIKKGAIIEECYFIHSKGGDKALDDFYFEAKGKKGKNALLLGFGSIYNHSDEPNADYTINLKTRVATITAEKTILKGKEIFVSYGDKWFSSRDLKPKKIPKRPKHKSKK